MSNCCTSVSQFDPEALPDITAATPSYRFQFPDDEDLSQPITEEEIQEAVGQLRDGRAPGADGISAELLKLGGAKPSVGSSHCSTPSGTVRASPQIGSTISSSPFTRRAVDLNATTTGVLPS